ncbi:glucose-6-phosphate isomerase [Leucobacter sp. GX24907]
MTVDLEVGSHVADAEAGVSRLVADRAASRLFAGDAGLWGPEHRDEALHRLGWTHCALQTGPLITEITEVREALRSDGVDRVVLCGMGGSSLAPEIISRWGGVALEILDSTHPEQVRRAVDGDLGRTAVVVSSKSGSTIDTLSHLATFEHAYENAGIDAASRIVIVTDAGSPLEAESLAAGRRVFRADPDVGGRYSALTAFGLVPSGLAGADIAGLVAEAEAVQDEFARDDAENPAIGLAALLAAGLPDRYLLALRSAVDADWELGEWVEQLIAESTGKNGTGMLPIALQRDAPEFSEEIPDTMLVSTIAAEPRGADAPALRGAELIVSGALGAQLLLWESATALLGRLLGINPFDQPDVESAKEAAREILRAEAVEAPALCTLRDVTDVEVLSGGTALTDSARVCRALRSAVRPDGYVSVQAYLTRDSETDTALEALRDELFRSLGVPVTLDWGPRFLHSTGQFHKGGPARGVFLQILDRAEPELDIPGSETGFGALISAQAHGDRRVLLTRGMPVIALRCSQPKSLADALRRALVTTD